ncbi:UNVERIFIED_CONTAM: hypothetical protein FKN15_002456 [Acipenser sinensis]
MVERALWGERSRQALFSVADVVYLGTIHPQHHPVGLLFLRAKKNLLCEKPLAMNMREVLELTAAARENDVFLMENGCALIKPLPRGVQGESYSRRAGTESWLCKVASLCWDSTGSIALTDAPAALEDKIGRDCFSSPHYRTGACPREGCHGRRPKNYIFQKPLVLNEKHQGAFQRMALWTRYFPASIQISDVLAQGVLGEVKLIPAPMWSPTSLIMNGNETQFPLPEPSQPLNFPNSTGLRYEAQEVRRCLLAGTGLDRGVFSMSV